MDIKIGIGDLSRRTGCKIETIRYYEKIRLMPNPPRTTGGHRMYGPDHVKRLTFIRRARGLGFSMDQIKGLLTLVDNQNQSCADIASQTEQHLVTVRKRILALQNMERSLSQTLTQCHRGDTPDCAIIDALFGSS